jgi:hypothetical protein
MDNPEKLATISNCKMKDGLVPQIPECDIIANRLSLEEIRKLPKFEKYEEGVPNNVSNLRHVRFIFPCNIVQNFWNMIHRVVRMWEI